MRSIRMIIVLLGQVGTVDAVQSHYERDGLQFVMTSQSAMTSAWQASRVCGLRALGSVPIEFIACSSTLRSVTALAGDTRTRSVQQRPLPWQFAIFDRPNHMQWRG